VLALLGEISANPPATSHPVGSVGIWKAAPAQVEAERQRIKELNEKEKAARKAVYHGVGNDLYWLAPYGGWNHLATFADGRFQVQYEGGPVWVLERVDPAQLDDADKPLTAEREPYDYARHVQPLPTNR